MSNSFIYFFKLCRKIDSSWARMILRIRIRSYHYLSQKRFNIHPTTSAGKSFSIQSDLTDTVISSGEFLRVRDNFKITMGHAGQLSIGHHCFFNNNCSVNCLGKIEIGNNCQFGENVLFYDHNHQYANKTKLIAEQGYAIGSIKIGNNCWVGSNVIILKSVEIGDNVVIGAGCVIYKSIESNSVVFNQQNLVIKKETE